MADSIVEALAQFLHDDDCGCWEGSRDDPPTDDPEQGYSYCVTDTPDNWEGCAKAIVDLLRPLFDADIQTRIEAELDQMPHGQWVDGNGRPRPCPMEWPGGPCQCFKADIRAMLRKPRHAKSEVE